MKFEQMSCWGALSDMQTAMYIYVGEIYAKQLAITPYFLALNQLTHTYLRISNCIVDSEGQIHQIIQ